MQHRSDRIESESLSGDDRVSKRTPKTTSEGHENINMFSPLRRWNSYPRPQTAFLHTYYPSQHILPHEPRRIPLPPTTLSSRHPSAKRGSKSFNVADLKPSAFPAKTKKQRPIGVSSRSKNASGNNTDASSSADCSSAESWSPWSTEPSSPMSTEPSSEGPSKGPISSSVDKGREKNLQRSRSRRDQVAPRDLPMLPTLRFSNRRINPNRRSDEAIRDALSQIDIIAERRKSVGDSSPTARTEGKLTEGKQYARSGSDDEGTIADLEALVMKGDVTKYMTSTGSQTFANQKAFVQGNIMDENSLSELGEAIRNDLRQDAVVLPALASTPVNQAAHHPGGVERKQSTTDDNKSTSQSQAGKDNRTEKERDNEIAGQPPASTIVSSEPQRNVVHEVDDQFHVPGTTDKLRRLQTCTRAGFNRLYHIAIIGATLVNYLISHREPPVEPGRKRIRWTCRCGAPLWDDFKELRPGAAEDLRSSLDFYQLNNSTQGSEGITQYTDTASGDSSSGEPLELSSFENSPDSLHVRSMQNIDATSTNIDNATKLGSQHGNNPEIDKRFLLLCISRKHDTLRLKQLNIEDVRSDFQLFNMLKSIYLSHQGTISRFVSLRKLASVNFRKIERHPRERVVLLSAKDILPQRYNPSACHKDHTSPKCDTAYDIDPAPPDLEPYVGRNGLEHLLNHPHEAEEEGNNLPVQQVWLKRFPKKEKTKLTVCPPYQYGLGWGVELEEEWNMSWVMKAITSSLVLAATLFLIVWWKFRDDVQGATGMAAFLVSCGTLLMAYFSAVSLV